MKKQNQINLSRPHAGKLCLNKKTISNLTATEMSKHIGGSVEQYGCSGWCGNGRTKNGNTCPGHNTCSTCVTCVTCG